MSYIGIRELRDRFESKWLNGDFKFGYLSDINDDVNADYPLLLVTPPDSVIPDETTNMADYEFQAHILKPYYQNQAGSLDVVFDLIEQEALIWLQSVLDSYTKSEVILKGEIVVERSKERFNDKLLQITLTFTLNTFRKAFGDYDKHRVDSLSPAVWLRSDSGVKTKFYGGNEVVSKMIDQSGNGNHFDAIADANMCEFKYESSDCGLPYLYFDGVDGFMKCVNNGINNGAGIPREHTIIWVAKADSDAVIPSSFLTKNADPAVPNFEIKIAEGEEGTSWQTYLNDGIANGNHTALATDGLATELAIVGYDFHNKGVHIFKNSVQDGNDNSPHFTAFDDYGVERAMALGSYSSSSPDRLFKGEFYELIIFPTDLSHEQIQMIQKYLMHKYGI